MGYKMRYKIVKEVKERFEQWVVYNEAGEELHAFFSEVAAITRVIELNRVNKED
jgi:hypothetical protein